MKTDDLKVFINGTEVAQFISEELEVPSKKDFKVPLTISISTDSIAHKNSINGLLSSLFYRELKVQYKGEIKYKIFGYSSTYDVDETQNVKIKL